MLFVEPRFLPFFLAVFAVHWLLRRNGARKVWLLAASYVFYGAWDWRFLGLIALSTVGDWAFALRIASAKNPRLWVRLSVCANLGLLGFFKYFGFFVDSAVALLASLGLEAHRPTLAIVLPVGISFYTFQSLSYTIDVYRGTLRATRSLLDFALFVAFFPQLVAGPIVRAVDFLPQLERKTVFNPAAVRPALVLLLVGFFKKAVVSDNLALHIDRYFAAPEEFGALSAWIATLAYGVQIYCDFSGYTDMALGCAGLLGYSLCLNFAHPYLARDITSFWRRWHISLSTWLRDYLYVPLGGSRGSNLFTYRNLMLTMLLGGLWHGAAWTFVAWGGLHGLGLVVHRIWRARVREGSGLRRAFASLGLPLTLGFVCLGWIFFRAESFADAWTVLRACAFLGAGGDQRLDPRLLLLIAALAVLHAHVGRNGLGLWWQRIPGWAFSLALAALVALTLAVLPFDAKPFIYFQF